jgi:hypothetical protein
MINNNRIINNNKMIDELFDDYINVLIDKYNLHDYKYIDDVVLFSLLPMRGSMKYINRYTNDMKKGGLLIKIYIKNNKYYGIIKKNDKKYHVSFNNNHIFYKEHITRNNKIRTILESIIDNVNKNKYNILN